MLYTGKSLRSTVYKRKELPRIKFSLEYVEHLFKISRRKSLMHNYLADGRGSKKV